MKPVVSRVQVLSKMIRNSLDSNTIAFTRNKSGQSVIPVKLEVQGKSTKLDAMIDSGATISAIHKKHIKEKHIPTQPRPVVTVNDASGRTLAKLERRVVGQVTAGTSTTPVELEVFPTGKHDVILGQPWLQEANPTIDWVEKTITFPVEAASLSAEIAAKAQIKDKRTTKELVPEEYHEFLDVFSEVSADTLPEHQPWDLSIDLKPDAKLPKPRPTGRFSDADKRELQKWTAEMLKKKFIVRVDPSTDPKTGSMAAPVFFVKKKDGSKRLVVDWRDLNDITIPDRHPLPRADDLVEALRGTGIYTKLDLKAGYNLVRIKKGDEWKTAFKTHEGTFYFNVMHFGLMNAPAAFQRLMNHVLRAQLDRAVLCYLDDILVKNRLEDREEHRRTVKWVLQQLRDAKLVANAKKCFFEKEEIDYLGIVASAEGIRMEDEKTNAIAEWRAPSNVRDVRSFLGFLNFYRRFIPEFSKVAQPLHNLERKAVPWQWGTEEQQSFEELKRLVSSAPVLAHPDETKPYRLETDASGYAYGGVLSQKQDKDRRFHPLGFMSKSMTPAEKKYDIYDKEMLAIVKALNHWKHLLERTEIPIDILTDHKNLEYFKTTRILNGRQARWLDFLAHFNFLIRFRPGTQSGKPDALSRRSDHREVGEDEDSANVLLKPEFFAEVAALSANDDIITDEIRRLTPEDPALRPIIAYFSNDPRNAPHDVQKRMEDFELDDGLVFRKGKVYVPANEEVKRKILELYHDTTLAGHPGQAKTFELLSRAYYWPSAKAWVNKYVDSCDSCQRNKTHQHRPIGFLKSLEVPEGPWQAISYDFITDLPPSNGFDSIMVVLCRLTKEAHFIPTNKTVDAIGTAKLLINNVWKAHGLPIKSVSDRGTQFNSETFKEVNKQLGIQQSMSTAFHPQSDGQTERVNPTLEHFLRAFTHYRQDNWADLLPHAEFSYNNSLHSSTGKTPFFATRGYHPTFTTKPVTSSNPGADDLIKGIHEVQEDIRSSMAEAQRKQAEFYDRHREATPSYNVGDKVWLEATNLKLGRPTKKLGPKRVGPYRILAKVGTHAYKLELPDSMKIHPVFHVVLLTKYTENPIAGRVVEPPPPEEIEGEDEYVVDKIIDSKYVRNRLKYLVSWEGYSEEHNSWIDHAELNHAREAVQEFHQANPNAASPTLRPSTRRRPLRGSNVTTTVAALSGSTTDTASSELSGSGESESGDSSESEESVAETEDRAESRGVIRKHNVVMVPGNHAVRMTHRLGISSDEGERLSPHLASW